MKQLAFKLMQDGEDLRRVISLTPPWQAVKHMYHRCNGPPGRQNSVCTVEAILDNCFTELVFCGLSCFPFGCIIF